MSLENIQYDTIMHEYNRRQLRSRHVLEERKKKLYRQIPRLKEIRDDIAALSANRVRRLLSEDRAESASAYEAKLADLARERLCLLKERGFPPDYLEMPFECPICRDTGYDGGQKCVCFQKMAADLFCQQYGLGQILEKENFERFSFSCYSDKIKDSDTGKTPLEHARFAVEKAWEFIRHFDETPQNLFIYGDTGVGKTFLSHCIACEILKKAYSTLYFPSYDLFNLLAKETFARESGDGGIMEYVLNCDLLILDDLGTEMPGQFVTASLYGLLNDRILYNRPMVISTNLNVDEISRRYSPQIASRLHGSFSRLTFVGEDIRVMKNRGM